MHIFVKMTHFNQGSSLCEAGHFQTYSAELSQVTLAVAGANYTYDVAVAATTFGTLAAVAARIAS